MMKIDKLISIKPMSLMVKIILFMSVLFLVLSCSEKRSTETDTSQRIKLKEIFILNGSSREFMIIQVDSVEYLTQTGGGFLKISK